MKGILYGNFLLNKKWFLWAGIAAVLGTAICAVSFLVLGEENAQLVSDLLLYVEIVVLAFCDEWAGRNFENNIKCRFTDLTLAGGITKNTFVLSELLNNVISIGIGFLMCCAMRGVLCIFDGAFWSLGHLRFLTGFSLAVGALDFALLPLVINLKSAEKAGLIVGLIAGFGIVLPLIAVINVQTGGHFEEVLMKVVGADWFFPAVVGACVAVYAIFYAVLLHRVKRGDVC